MTSTYDEQKSKLQSIDEEKEMLEKMKKQVKQQEEEMERETAHSMQQLNDSMERWQDDASLQKIFYEQQKLLAGMQQKRSEFNDDFDKHMRTYTKQLAEREEACWRELRDIEREDEGKEKKISGNNY